MNIASVATAQAPHYYEQEQLLEAFREVWSKEHFNPARVEQLHRAVQVGGRYLALPMDAYAGLRSFTEANDAFIRVGLDMAASALTKALDVAGRRPDQLDAIFFASVTGLATPSIDARLVNRLGLRTDLKRTPIFGLGCVAGAAGIARMYDYLRAWPEHTAALVCVELCSLTLQRQDLSIANLIASGLFGDGAAAVVGTGAAVMAASGRPVPNVIATRSRFYPNTERVMGWDIGETGFKIVLDASVPALVERYLAADVDGFLSEQGLGRRDIASWICHPGGPKVLDAIQSALDLPEDALALTWRSLREIGNLSSASVLHVLADTIRERPQTSGAYGVLLAMGPGFCSELVLLRW